jgi:superfamily II DNA or RNA helicase
LRTIGAEWVGDEGLTSYVRESFEKALGAYRADPELISEHANHEESIRTGGYSRRTLLELVQNAADAMSGADDGEHQGRVEIVLDIDNRTLYCANGGRPFSRSGITAIVHAHVSGKRGDEIGRFGLGFKSVLAVTRAPQVFSRSVSFEFDSTEAQNALSQLPGGAKRFPALRTATLLDPQEQFDRDPTLKELATWAVTVVKLPSAQNLQRLRAEIESFASEFLLFVTSVRQVRLRILGEDPFETTHVSRDLGADRFKIERPDGSGDEWIVRQRMHGPSREARVEVGEAVSRDQVKVSIAIPARHAQQRVGQFWSYFPLQDQTSASALFNAPWSVNDDRTTLLRNEYNREILHTLAEMFVDAVTEVRTESDPAAHLDYLPARGREERSFGDAVLCADIPRLSASRSLTPDATGALAAAGDLRPLDVTISVPEEIHQAWIESPNTGEDVPHWRCYSSPQRVTRLRTLLTSALPPELIDDDSRDMKRALAQLPKRGLLSWLREWADGTDVVSAANAFRYVASNRGLPEIDHAKVIPTSGGLRSIRDKNTVFFDTDDDLDIENAVFIDPRFVAERGVENLLRERGFRNLDPIAVLNARLEKVGSGSDEDLAVVWDAMLDVSTRDALEIVKNHSRATLMVPTRDGGWSWPHQVVDLDEQVVGDYARIVLDRGRCVPEVAHALGVVRGPVKNYDIDNELFGDRYRDWAIENINSRLGPGERPVERINLFPRDNRSPGPFSILFVLREANGSLQTRESWTRSLLEFGDSPWDCEDADSGNNYRVDSPVRWAVGQAGIVNSTRGFRAPREVVAPSMVRYELLLPLFVGPRTVADALSLPDEFDQVPPEVLRAALASDGIAPAVNDDVLIEFILSATRAISAEGRPPQIPARVGRTIEANAPRSVYVAIDDDQREYLSSRQRPFLRTDAEQAEELISRVGCGRFEDSFSFSLLIDGSQESQRVLDVFTGLRSLPEAEELTSAVLKRVTELTKRVTTADGVEDQSLPWHLDGTELIVRSDTEEWDLLGVVNDAFDLRLTPAERADVRKAGLDHRLEVMRQLAHAASSDVERLDVYFGNDDLREALPKGLWQALIAQKLVDKSTSVADLYLTVFGAEAIEMLAPLFIRDGFTDVPRNWTGGDATVSWLRKMGFGTEYAGKRTFHQDDEFVVPGAVKLSGLHDFQKEISRDLRDVLTRREPNGRALKAMVELPTGAGKTRVATETVLRLFIDGQMSGPVLWVAQSQELCEQAVQTWSTVWRGLGDERPLTIGRLWEGNSVHEPDTEFSVIVATDAKLDVVREDPDYEWLSRTATAVIVDEGHRAGVSERYTRILAWLGVAGRGWERPLVGLSATPFKNTSIEGTRRLAARFGDRKLRAFDSDPYQRLAEIGVLARVRHEVLETGFRVALTSDEQKDARRLRRVAPSILDKVAADQERMRILVNDIMRRDSSWPILVFTPNVLSAQVLAATLKYRDVEAAAVSGQTSRQARRDRIEDFKRGRIRVLTNCDLLIQGFDAPGVRALYIARPTFSPNAYIQMAGRGLRGVENGGKEECLIVDMEDNFGDVNDLLGFREFEDLWTEQT